MLVLSRKVGEKVVIGNGVTVCVTEVNSNRVRLAFDAPDDVRILRSEFACWQDEAADRAEPGEYSFVCEW